MSGSRSHMDVCFADALATSRTRTVGPCAPCMPMVTMAHPWRLRFERGVGEFGACALYQAIPFFGTRSLSAIGR
jgi:hypothetical protein